MSAHVVSWTLRNLGFEPRIIPAMYVVPFVKGQKNDHNDAEAIAEAALRPNLRAVKEKTQDQLDLQALHRVQARLVSRRTATIDQIRAFLIGQGIAVHTGAHALRKSLFPILDQRRDEISERMHDIIIGFYEDWLWLDERIESVSGELDVLSDREAHCQRLKSIPGIGPNHLDGCGLLHRYGRSFRPRSRLCSLDRARTETAQYRWQTDPRAHVEARQQISQDALHPMRPYPAYATNQLAEVQLWPVAGTSRQTLTQEQARCSTRQQARPDCLECSGIRQELRSTSRHSRSCLTSQAERVRD